MAEEKGRISVDTENIFPIIKKWLYSEKDIFFREIVSNASDAITKLKKIALTESFEGGSDYRIDVTFDQKKRTLTVEDNGIGMTVEEVKKYINQIAFSSAEDFIKQYEKNDKNPGIIGHFGLGFYSTFMVSVKVELETRSWKGGDAVIWSSESGTDFTIATSDKATRGTKLTLTLDADSGEYLDKWKLKELVKKYCDFLPVPIHVDGEAANKQTPLWSKQPSSLKEEDYKEFYNYLFPFAGEPLFWIHLNVDHPFNLQGILYFPSMKHELDVSQKGMKLFCNHVYVSDDANELIPQFLTVLKGTIDIPDLPLNVSRSYLQTDPLVKKISSHIVKKVADKISELYNKDKETFLKHWEDISVFVKYGMMTDDKFFEGAGKAVMFKSSNGGFVSLDDYWTNNREKNGNKVFYAPEAEVSTVYMDMLKAQGMEAILVDNRIDLHFIQFLESKNQEMKFQSVDSDVMEQIVDKEKTQSVVDGNNQTEADRVCEFFKKSLALQEVEVKAESLKSAEVPAVILLPEHVRRMAEMTPVFQHNKKELYKKHTLLLNLESPLVKNALNLAAGVNPDKADKLARQIYDLARKSYMAVKTFGNGDQYDMIHTENFMLIDKSRQIRGFYDGTKAEDIERLLNDIKILKKEYQ